MDSRRAAMVEHQLRPHGISEARVLAAMAEVPREEFVAEAQRPYAYDDRALVIAAGQTISQPLVVATMTQALSPRADQVALEVGTGSGYQAAVLSRLCSHVVSIELEAELVSLARANLARVGYDNVTVVAGDGKLGWAERAPYPLVLVACAATEVPAPLLAQLGDPGRLVMPVGGRSEQVLKLLVRERERFTAVDLFPVRFVPLR